MSNGMIEWIYVKNFLTYTECSVNFKEGLNIIYGPNGSGKSSIMCAICLILGGSHKIMNRSKELSEYIRRGENEAEIEIKLYSNESKIIIKRIISLLRKNIWILNGNNVKEKDIIELIKKLNINVNNLCNFLPQDRVSDFFKMNPQQLLMATEEIINDGNLLEMHNKLIQLHKETKDKEISYEEKKKELEKLESRIQIIEEEVLKYENWKENCNQIKYLEKKLNWQKYEESRVGYIKIKNKRIEAEKKYDETCKSLAPQKYKIESNINEINVLKNNIIKNNNKSSYVNINAYKNYENLIKINKKKLNEIKDKKNLLEGNIKTLESLKNLHDSLEIEYHKESEVMNNIDLEINDIKNVIDKEINELCKINNDINQIRSKIHDNNNLINRLKDKFKYMNDSKNRSLDIIKEKDIDTYKALEWLNNNKNIFNGEICDPLFLDIKLKNNDDAKFLECHISKRDLFAFICENNDDLHLFVKNVREKMSLRTSCLVADINMSKCKFNDKDYNIIKKMKFKCYLKDIFNTSNLQMAFLCQAYNVHNIPIFDEISEEEIDLIINKTDIRCFFTKNEKYTIKISNYSKKPSVITLLLRTTMNILTQGYSEKDMDNIKNKLEDYNNKDIEYNKEINKFKEKTSMYDKNITELKLNKNELEEKKIKYHTICSQINRKKKEIESIEKMNEKLKVEIDNLINDKKENMNKIILLHKDIFLLIDETKKYNNDTIINYMKINLYNYMNKKFEDEFNSLNILLNSQREHLDLLKNEEILNKNETKKLLNHAKQLCGIQNNTIPNDLLLIFKNLPDNIDEINSLIKQLTILNKNYRNFDPDIVEKYNELKKQQISLKSLITTYNESLKIKIDKEQELKLMWLSSLKQFIDQANYYFQLFFNQIKSIGLLQLYQDPNNDFHLFSLQILVSFRSNEQPIQLSHARHSGGEKAISTILFLMSIQQLSTSPFKMVDEINQGMDSNNERIMFEIIVKTISQLNLKTQYFVLSPKILPNMDFLNNVTVHCIFNGPYINYFNHNFIIK